MNSTVSTRPRRTEAREPHEELIAQRGQPMSERILIVEDDDALRYALCREVEAAGYDATQAHDYRDALAGC